MSSFVAGLKQLVGLFVDDGGLAVGIVALVAALAMLVRLDWIGATPAAGLLAVGLVLLLLETVWRAARNRRR